MSFDSIKSQIQTLIDDCAAVTGNEATDLTTQVAAVIEGYGRGETIEVVNLASVEVYVGDYADSDALSVESGAVNIYGRYITT